MFLFVVLALIGPLQFIKEQDKLFKEEHAKKGIVVPSVRLFLYTSEHHAEMLRRAHSRKPRAATAHRSRSSRRRWRD